MKILILLKKWPGGVGGGVKNLIKELGKEGHIVDAIAREEDLHYYSLVKSFIPLRRKIKRLIKEGNYDIIYTQDWTLAAPLLFPTKIFRRKHFSMFHGHQIGLTKIFQIIVGFLMGENLMVMAPSLKKKFRKASINYCGVNQNQFRSLRKKRTYLGWTKKGTETIKLSTLKKISRKIDLPLNVADGLPHEAMNDFYNNCQIFISLPPRSAGFQASWLEAMMAGVPIIIGNENGAGEIQPFDKIPLGKENDVSFIVNKINGADKKDYIGWIKEKDFSWKRHAKQLIKIFSKKI